MSTAVLVPVLGRPHRVAPLVASIAAATPEDHRVLFIASESDPQQLAAIAAAGADVLVVPDDEGTYSCKINAGYRHTDDDEMFLAADDLLFHAGWLTEARRHLTDGIEVVGTNDLGSQRVRSGAHATHNLITRSYIAERSGVFDQPDTVLHEGYPHAYCDDELVTTARWRGVWTFAERSIVEHLHPFFGKGEDDATYRLGIAGNQKGKHEWARRQPALKKSLTRARV